MGQGIPMGGLATIRVVPTLFHRGFFCLALTLGLGCAHRTVIQADVPGAEVRRGKRALGPAPQELVVVWVPFRPHKLQVSAPGYRTATVNLYRDVGPIRLLGELLWPPRWGQLVAQRPRSVHEVVMVRRHGRSGTWTAEDAQR